MARAGLVFGALVTAAALTLLVGPDALLDRVLSAVAAWRETGVGPTWRASFRAIAADATIAGAMIAALAFLRIRATTHERAFSDWAAVPGIILATVVLYVIIAFFTHTVHTSDGRVWFLADDAMISMRYGANLARGDGLVWNIGERVEGYTNFLWTVVMGGVHLLPISRLQTSAVVLAMNIGLCGLLMGQTYRLGRAVALPRMFLLVVLVLCGLSREILLWSLSGLETIAIACLFITAVTSVATSAGGAKGVAIASVAAMPLLRADAIVLSGLVTLFALWGRADRRAAWQLGGAALLVAACHTGFRLAYYGEWLPNTAHLKVTAGAQRLYAGAAYTAAFGIRHAIVVLFAAAGVWVLRDRRSVALAAIMALHVVYVVAVGGDAFEGARFFVPILPLLFVLGGVGAHRLARGRRSAAALAALLLVSTPLLLPNPWIPRAPALVSRLHASYADVGNVQIGLWLRGHTPLDARVADFWAGSVFYFSDRAGVDLLGKMDPVIARMPAVCGDGLPGHDKFDFAHSLLARQPDFLVAGFATSADGVLTGPSGEPIGPMHTSGSCNMFGALAAHSAFRDRFQPNVATRSYWRTVYRRR